MCWWGVKLPDMERIHQLSYTPPPHISGWMLLPISSCAGESPFDLCTDEEQEGKRDCSSGGTKTAGG